MQVQRGEIAGGVVEEHIFGAGVRGDDRAAAGQVCQSLIVVWNCRPGSAQAQAAWPILSQSVARLEGLVRPCRRGGGQLPIAVFLDRAQKSVGDADRIVGVLAGDGEIGFLVPIGGEGLEVDVGLALTGELDRLA